MTVENIGVCTTNERVCTQTTDKGVNPGTPTESIVAAVADQCIPTSATGEVFDTGEQVQAGTGCLGHQDGQVHGKIRHYGLVGYGVGAESTIEVVISSTVLKNVIPEFTFKEVITQSAVQCIVPESAPDIVVLIIPYQCIIVVGASQIFDTTQGVGGSETVSRRSRYQIGVHSIRTGDIGSHVVAATTVQRIGAFATDEDVVKGITGQNIIMRRTGEILDVVQCVSGSLSHGSGLGQQTDFHPGSGLFVRSRVDTVLAVEMVGTNSADEDV